MATIKELREAMAALAEDPRVVFIGQSVAYPGQRAHETFADVPINRRIEMPICEDFTVGFAIGVSMAGDVPLVFLPRWDFLLCAANQLVNHLDAMGKRYGARVIIRTAIGASCPLDPGPQHTRDGRAGFFNLCSHITLADVSYKGSAKETYRWALNEKGSVIITEHMSSY